MLRHKIIQDDPINFGNVKRRRVRVLVPPGTQIDRKEVRDLAFAIRDAVWGRSGPQAGISVIFFDDLFTLTCVLGCWDYCPNGVWGDCVDSPSSSQQWVLERKYREPAQVIGEMQRRRSRGVDSVDP